MTNRALSKMPERFSVGVSEYGFMHQRLMSLEGGDLTWESEYVGEIAWPLSDAATVSDCLFDMHRVKAPILFTHGADDDICPSSQSLIGYRALLTAAVPTQLVIYPGEKHGYNKVGTRTDRCLRYIKWLHKHMPAPPIE